MNRKIVLGVLVFLGVGAIVLGLLWLREANVSAEPQAVPHAAVGDGTLMVTKIDLAQLRTHLRAAAAKANPSAPADSESGLRAVLGVLAGEGVTQIVVPFSLRLGSGGGIGLYLGGYIGRPGEELESRILASDAGKGLKALTMMSSIVPCGGGWRFWGLGSGRLDEPDAKVAARFEENFRRSGAGMMQVVMLRDPKDPKAEISPAATDARVVRQLKRLLAANREMQSLRWTLTRKEGADGELSGTGEAIFPDEPAARQFADRWQSLMGGLVATAGPSDEPGLLDRLLAPLLQAMANSTPKVEGNAVRWKD